ncbi:hypothetical protein [Thermostichus vulcanus]|uniref:Uncharacterized protein n=1 Tax=Thermostichus vulcanus str. 'Rupite' TaxID=2813851 RepID=A0ABT0CDT0_THEVL|nr:hypothetical protein [Thermostichus vulcanus]MCJ2543948.1 hypothetical protein [Thermostichus vulcanus str. 'Rupite']
MFEGIRWQKKPIQPLEPVVFIGDAIMAELGTPLFRDAATEALAAVRAAVRMRIALEQLRTELRSTRAAVTLRHLQISINGVG